MITFTRLREDLLSDQYLLRVIAYQVKKYYHALDRQYNINFKGLADSDQDKTGSKINFIICFG